ncbi:MAG: hypothetical protein MJ114_04900 [Acetatifactor sp.]|nr:hypothetical protein [Acetatifactor sp.]
MDFEECIKERLREVEQMLDEIEKRKPFHPEGHLRVSNNGERTTYYHCAACYDDRYPGGKYIRKKDRALASQLAQKEYEQDLQLELEGEKHRLEKVLKNCGHKKSADIYGMLSPARKHLVTPLVYPVDIYREIWESQPYQGKAIQSNAVSFETERGELVRSKSEKILADKFYVLNIPYKYEHPFELRGYGTVYPDFTILNVRTGKEILWEHMGMMGDPEYCMKAINKINRYAANGIFIGDRLIVSFESENRMDMSAIDVLIHRYLL